MMTKLTNITVHEYTNAGVRVREDMFLPARRVMLNQRYLIQILSMCTYQWWLYISTKTYYLLGGTQKDIWSSISVRVGESVLSHAKHKAEDNSKQPGSSSDKRRELYIYPTVWWLCSGANQLSRFAPPPLPPNETLLPSIHSCQGCTRSPTPFLMLVTLLKL